MPKKGIKARGNGQGCAVRVKANCWKAIATVGYTEDGKAVRRTKSGFPTKTEALAYIPILKRIDSAKRKAPIKLMEAYKEWWKTLSVSQSTMWCYQAGMKLFADLMYVPMENLEIDDLQECLDSADTGKRTKQNAKIALGLVYKWAIPRGFLPNNINMASFLKVHSDEEKVDKPSFTDEQLERIHSHGSRIAKMVYCHCYLGFRPTAFLGLTAADYDAERKCFVGGIKTEAGKGRTVTVSPKIQPLVDEFITQSHGKYVFGEWGQQMSLSKYRKSVYSLMEQLGFQAKGEHTYTPHTCRHTFATLMKRVNAPDKDKLELMGHTDSAMLRYYQDVAVEDLRKITDVM